MKKPFKNRDIVIKATGKGRAVLPNRSFVAFKNGKCSVMLTNNTKKDIKLRHGMRLANIDMETSFGVFPKYKE